MQDERRRRAFARRAGFKLRDAGGTSVLLFSDALGAEAGDEIDFLRADELFEGPHVIVPSRRGQPEERFLAIGRVAGRSATVVYTLRNGHRRIISMRGARDAERRIHQKLHG